MVNVNGTSTGKADPANRSYIPSLDGLRAVSILIVFLSHVGFGHIVPGGFGVTVFFFLSGYLITMLLTREWDRYQRISQGAFYLRRFVRLGPPILITLAFSLILLGLGLVEGRFDLMTLLSQIFFFYNYYSLSVPDAGTVDGLDILWSLAVEEHFYLLWPSLFIVMVRWGHEKWGVVLLLLAIPLWRTFRFYYWGDSEWSIYLSTDTRFDSLLYGCFLAVMTWRGLADRLFPCARWVRMGYIIGALAVLLVCLVVRDPAFRSTLRYSLQGLALMPLFHYAVTRPNDLIFRPLNWIWVRKIGQWSYTIYLVHFVIIKALIFNGVANQGEPVLVVLAAVLSIVYAATVYRWAEVPLLPLRRKLTGHSR